MAKTSPMPIRIRVFLASWFGVRVGFVLFSHTGRTSRTKSRRWRGPRYFGDLENDVSLVWMSEYLPQERNRDFLSDSSRQSRT